MKKNSDNNIFAGGLILVGILLVFKTFNVPFLENFNLGYVIGLLWPLFILIPGLNMLKRKVDFGGLIVTLLGASFLLDNILKLYNVDFKAMSVFKFFWPLLFIYLGVKILTSNKRMDKMDNDTYDYYEQKENLHNSTEERSSITFGSKKFRYNFENMNEGITKLNLNISFGGAEIIVEEGIQVILIGQYTFGGHEFFGQDAGGIHSDIKEVRYHEDDTSYYDKTLMINSTITFGGIEIKQR